MTLPIHKPKINKWYLIGGGVGAVALLYAYKRRSAAATAGSPLDPNAAVDPNAVDPNLYGYSPASGGAVGTTPSLYGYLDPTTGQFIGGAGGSTVVTAPSSNAQWAQQAIAYLVQLGYDPVTVATALGKYLGNVNLTANEMQIVQAALGAEGNPPTPVPPPHVAPPAGQTNPPAGGAVHIPDGYYTGWPSQKKWQVQNNGKWQVTAATWKRLSKTHVAHPITDVTLSKLTTRGII